MNYRSDQKDIINYESGTMALPAVPGAGKTFILTHLAGKLILEGNTESGKILILSYMTSSCSNIKSRIIKFLEEKGINSTKDFEVMTIHSLAMKIIKEKPDVLNLSDEFKMIDSVLQASFIKQAIIDFRKRYTKEFDSFIDPNKKKNIKGAYDSIEDNLTRCMTSFIGEMKCKGISVDMLKDITKDIDYTDMMKLACDIYESYDLNLRKQGLVDYNDLLFMAYKLLKEDEDLRDKFQNRYAYIFEDECQDSNEIQGKILEILAQKHGNLVRVGDLNQSITGTFTSSDPRFFREFCKSADRIQKMFTAGRSSKEVIDLANYLVNWVREDHPVSSCRNALENQIVLTVPEGENPQNPINPKYGIASYIENSWEDSIRRFIQMVTLYKEKYPQKTIAALIPTGYMIGQIGERLQKMNIEYDELSDVSNEKLVTTKTLGKILDYISSPYDNEKFQIVLKDILINEQYDDSYKLYDFIKKCRLEDLLYPNEDLCIPDEIVELSVYKDFVSSLDLVRKFLEFPQLAIDRLILYIGEKLKFSREEKAMMEKIASDIRFLLISNPKWTLKDIAKELEESKNNKFNYFAKFVYELKGYEPTPGKITLSTLHKSKGLEWDCVFILGLTNLHFPVELTDKFMGECAYLKKEYSNPLALLRASLKKLLNEEDIKNPTIKAREETISERARLLYVAITRAKENLILIGHKENQELPSIYIKELKKFIESEKNRYVGC
ncbi:DNA helicase II [Alkalithermobacter paradoxus]|uniref:DNA 3'-5' helicase n=1 Tax=Alkalithermobacter paradoxus TaxID=29349 RepID=A0A1V4IA35_9FIRM|nr:DNA helicase II [[Clostridium] thermoalcaliphilum]